MTSSVATLFLVVFPKLCCYSLPQFCAQLVWTLREPLPDQKRRSSTLSSSVIPSWLGICETLGFHTSNLSRKHKHQSLPASQNGGASGSPLLSFCIPFCFEQRCSHWQAQTDSIPKARSGTRSPLSVAAPCNV